MIKHILFATDFSLHSDQVLMQVRNLARAKGARVTLMHVNQHWLPVLADAYAIRYPASMGELSRELDASIRSRIEAQHERLRATGVETEFVIAQGHAGSELVAFARHAGCDIIMMGSRGHGPVSSVLLGSTSTYVLQHSPCPVLIMPVGRGAKLVS